MLKIGPEWAKRQKWHAMYASSASDALLIGSGKAVPYVEDNFAANGSNDLNSDPSFLQGSLRSFGVYRRSGQP